MGTIGRLKDFLDRGLISFGKLQFLVLDEADRMLDMGFMEDIQYFMRHPSMPALGDRRTLMFSATFAENVQLLAGQFLQNYL